MLVILTSVVFYLLFYYSYQKLRDIYKQRCTKFFYLRPLTIFDFSALIIGLLVPTNPITVGYNIGFLTYLLVTRILYEERSF